MCECISEMLHTMDLTTTENVLNRLPNDWSSPQSPDELVIQRRGRRESIIWSPDLDACKQQDLLRYEMYMLYLNNGNTELTFMTFKIFKISSTRGYQYAQNFQNKKKRGEKTFKTSKNLISYRYERQIETRFTFEMSLWDRHIYILLHVICILYIIYMIYFVYHIYHMFHVLYVL